MGLTQRTVTGTVLVLVLATAVACGNAEKAAAPGGSTPATTAAAADAGPTGSYPPVTAPGVTPTEIRVGGIASVTNPLGGSYGVGVRRRRGVLRMVNEAGGIYGRQLVLAEKKDDTAVNNKADGQRADQRRRLRRAARRHPAVHRSRRPRRVRHPDLRVDDQPRVVRRRRQPQGEPVRPDRVVPRARSSRSPPYAYLAEELGVHKVGVLAYGVPQSAQCADGVKASVRPVGRGVDAEVVYFDNSLEYGDKNLACRSAR